MKVYYLIVMLFPMSIFAQANDACHTTDIVFHKKVTKFVSCASFSNMDTETALLNDTKKLENKMSLKFSPSEDVSLSIPFSNKFYAINEEVTERLLMGVGTLVNFNNTKQP